MVIPYKYIDKGLEILSQSLFHSLMDPKLFEIERDVIIKEYNYMVSEIASKRDSKFYSSIFKNTRMEIDIIGTLESIRKITPQLVKQFMNTYYIPENIIISVSGKISFPKIKKCMNQYFLQNVKYKVPENKLFTNDLQRIYYPDFVENIYFPTPQIHHIKVNEPQSYISMGFPIKITSEKDDCICRMITNIVANLRHSRLMKVLREEKGLVYNVSSGFDKLQDISLFSINFETEDDKSSTNILECIYLICKELNDLLTKKISSKEFKVAHDFALNRLTLEDIDNYDNAWTNISQLLYYDKIYCQKERVKLIKSITIDDIFTMCKKIFNITKCTIVYTSRKKIF